VTAFVKHTRRVSYLHDGDVRVSPLKESRFGTTVNASNAPYRR